MKRFLTAGLALVLVGVTSVAFAGSGGAAQAHSEMTLSPEVAGPGEEMTATSVDPCPDGDGDHPLKLSWKVTPSGSDDAVDSGEADVHGAWEVTFAAPETAGDYEFVGECWYYDGDYPATTYTAGFSVQVQDDDSPPDDGPSPAEPAKPIVAEPNFTG